MNNIFIKLSSKEWELIIAKKFFNDLNKIGFKSIVEMVNKDKVSLKKRGEIKDLRIETAEKKYSFMVKGYHRGGFFSKIFGDLFVKSDRAFKEAYILAWGAKHGLKVPEVISAIKMKKEKIGYLITKKLENSKDLAEFLNDRTLSISLRRKSLKKSGKIIKDMHDKGILHKDLNIRNIIVSDKEIYIVDFDKAILKKDLKPIDRVENLRRIDRSFEKYRYFGGNVKKSDYFAFLSGYGDRYLINKCKKGRWLSLLPHKIAWKLGIT